MEGSAQGLEEGPVDGSDTGRTGERIELGKRLLVATRNAGKLREFRRLLSGLDAGIVGLDDVGIADEVEETGETFAENASLKATEYARLSGLLDKCLQQTIQTQDRVPVVSTP